MQASCRAALPKRIVAIEAPVTVDAPLRAVLRNAGKVLEY
jgi:hypothetical protein